MRCVALVKISHCQNNVIKFLLTDGANGQYRVIEFVSGKVAGKISMRFLCTIHIAKKCGIFLRMLFCHSQE